jgi:hypothetical protein
MKVGSGLPPSSHKELVFVKTDYRIWTLAVAVVFGAFLIRWLGASAAKAGPQGSTAGRLGNAAGVDLNGIWQAIGTADWDIQDHSGGAGPLVTGALLAEPPGRGIVEGNEIPYKPEAMEKRKTNFEKRWAQDPEAKCYLPGVPRATYMPYPFQIVQTDRYILIAYEFAGAVRTIHMGQLKPNPVDVALDSWMGYSSGRWESKTLVVAADHFNDETWFDRSGNYHSDALKVTERYNLIDADHIAYEATMEDPKVFTKPWKISLPLYRVKDKNAELLEFKCSEFAEDFMYGHLYRKPLK